MPEQHASGLRLNRVRVDREQVIAEGALLLVPDPVGLQHLTPALRARHHEGRGGPVAWFRRADERETTGTPQRGSPFASPGRLPLASARYREHTHRVWLRAS